MSSSSGRAQAEPVVALVCVAVLGVALAGYATAYGDVLPSTDRDLASPALALVTDELVENAVAVPARLAQAVAATTRSVNVTLSAGESVWRAGPVPPAGADAAGRPIAVRVAPGDVRLGTLRVVVW